MKETVIKNIMIKKSRISAKIIVNGEENNVWYEFSGNADFTNIRPGNAFLIISLPIAMRTGEKLIIENPISENLLKQLETYQNIMKKWYPYLNKVEIEANYVDEDLKYESKDKTICCFTGGVDAFYSTLKNLNEIDDLLYVWGFDIPLTEKEFYKKVEKNLQDAAKELNKNLILVKTNVGYEFSNKYASWGDLCYGAAIASAVMLMENKYKRSIIPSCNDYAMLCPRGSHILLNHLWSCDGLSFEYDGAERSRVEKVDFISDYDVISKYLRVCYKSNDKYNCCKCEKCIRTMASLEAVDKLSKVKSFNRELNYQDIAATELENESEYKMAIDTKNFAQKNGKESLANYIDIQIKRYEIKQVNNFINNNFENYISNEESQKINHKIFDNIIENDTKKSFKSIIKVVFYKLFHRKHK